MRTVIQMRNFRALISSARETSNFALYYPVTISGRPPVDLTYEATIAEKGCLVKYPLSNFFCLFDLCNPFGGQNDLIARVAAVAGVGKQFPGQP